MQIHDASSPAKLQTSSTHLTLQNQLHSPVQSSVTRYFDLLPCELVFHEFTVKTAIRSR